MTAVAERLVEFVDALRHKGINAGPSETIDAGLVVDVLGLDQREQLREGLASALVRRGGQREVFDMTFDLFFPLGVGSPQAAHDAESVDVDQWRELLVQALADGDLSALEQLAQIAVDMWGRVGEPGTTTDGYSAYQTLDHLQPQTLIAPALALRQPDDGLADRLTRQEIRNLVEAFRDMVSAEARRRTAELRGRDIVVKHSVKRGPEQIDFLSANAQQLETLKKTVQPVARKLATRLSTRRRRRRRGQIDVRRTLRSAMSTGGVPVKPVYAKPRPTRPELVLLCDVSGSVSGFSTFTMLLTKALASQFSKIRVFAFVNAMAEVTDIVCESTRDGSDIAARIQAEARITKWHTSSDYGESFLDFVEDHLDVVGHRTAVLILGDARNNNQNPRIAALREIQSRSRRTFWLNPEDTSRWGRGDSLAPEYAEVVEMHECRTVEQLSTFISRLMPV